MRSDIWNPWHGCHRYSEGCRHCYVYRRDEQVGRDASVVSKTASFDLPVQKARDGSYKLPPGQTIYCCMTSDFFIEEADEWRPEIWRMMKERNDLHFIIITKRIVRFWECIPDDWGDGYDNVTLMCTVENQVEAARRLPLFAQIPARHKHIICEPLLSPIDLSPYLGGIEAVSVGGESGPGARVCDFDWVLDLHRQCVAARVAFSFHQTGARFRKDGRIYRIPRRLQHQQARKAGIYYKPR
ncbi:MAG: DUF5131 family protein [Clostridia bacterium]|nr:DUF5131 family protein [Clostridia bacterium]